MDQHEKLKKLKAAREHAYSSPFTEKSTLIAIQAFERGEADSEQQKRLFNWMIDELTQANALPWRPDIRETDFASGRAFVGHQLILALKTNVTE